MRPATAPPTPAPNQPSLHSTNNWKQYQRCQVQVQVQPRFKFYPCRFSSNSSWCSGFLFTPNLSTPYQVQVQRFEIPPQEAGSAISLQKGDSRSAVRIFQASSSPLKQQSQSQHLSQTTRVPRPRLAKSDDDDDDVTTTTPERRVSSGRCGSACGPIHTARVTP